MVKKEILKNENDTLDPALALIEFCFQALGVRNCESCWI